MTPADLATKSFFVGVLGVSLLFGGAVVTLCGVIIRKEFPRGQGLDHLLREPEVTNRQRLGLSLIVVGVVLMLGFLVAWLNVR